MEGIEKGESQERRGRYHRDEDIERLGRDGHRSGMEWCTECKIGGR